MRTEISIEQKTENLANTMPSALCGVCLHNRDAHTKHNGHFMQCSRCNKLCDLDEYLKVHKPTDLETIYKIQSAREIGTYIPKEVKDNAL